MKRAVLLTMTVILLSCGTKAVNKVAPRSGGTSVEEPKGGETSPEWELQLTDLQQEPLTDALGFVSGFLPVEYALSIGGERVGDGSDKLDALVVWDVENIVLLDEVAFEDLEEDEADLLESLCLSPYLTTDPDTLTADKAFVQAELGDTRFYVGWRAHFGSTTTDALAAFLLKHKTRVFCGLKIRLTEEENKSNERYILFDPVPVVGGETKASFFSGTESVESAAAAGVMLVYNDLEGGRPEGFEITELAGKPNASTSGSRQVAAVDPGLALTLAPDRSCSLRLTDQYTGDSEPVAITTEEHNAVFEIVAIEALDAPSGEPGGPCAEFAFATADGDKSALVAELTCEDVAAIYSAGAETCDLKITAVPKGDATADRQLFTSIAWDAEITDLTTPVGSFAVMPEAAGNPLRDSSVSLVSFTADQERELSRAFDLWMNVDITSFNDFFDGKILSIVNRDASDTNCTNAGAYAYLTGPNDDKFFWCPAGGLAEDLLTEEKSPTVQLYRAMTAFHETIHTYNKYHDHQEAAYASCTPNGGTSYSAILAVETFRCDEDYCFGLRDSARQQLKSEINYSLQNDSRRFSGTCADWASELGISY